LQNRFFSFSFFFFFSCFALPHAPLFADKRNGESAEHAAQCDPPGPAPLGDGKLAPREARQPPGNARGGKKKCFFFEKKNQVNFAKSKTTTKPSPPKTYVWMGMGGGHCGSLHLSVSGTERTVNVREGGTVRRYMTSSEKISGSGPDGSTVWLAVRMPNVSGTTHVYMQLVMIQQNEKNEQQRI
jgi:hypothetical protein